MSILLIGLGDDETEETIRRLTAQGDEVRVLEHREARVPRWKDLGAHVAIGAPDDADLVYRAASNCRTIVLGEEGLAGLDPVIEGIGRDSGVRLVLCLDSLDPKTQRVVAREKLDHLILTTGKPGLLRRGRGGPASVAIAIDAADDVAESPREVVDLTTQEGWGALKLEPPDQAGAPR